MLTAREFNRIAAVVMGCIHKLEERMMGFLQLVIATHATTRSSCTIFHYRTATGDAALNSTTPLYRHGSDLQGLVYYISFRIHLIPKEFAVCRPKNHFATPSLRISSPMPSKSPRNQSIPGYLIRRFIGYCACWWSMAQWDVWWFGTMAKDFRYRTRTEL